MLFHLFQSLRSEFGFFNVFSDMEARRPPDFDTAFLRLGLRTEIERAMKLMGCASIGQLSRQNVRFR